MRKNKEYYDEYGKIYEAERRSPYYEYINKEEVSFIAPYAKGKKTLEIGCGTGIILEEIAKIAKDARGIDLSEGMLATSRKKGLNVQQSDATSLPFKDEEFDLVYSCKVLAHVQDIKKALSEITRVTKSGGYMLLEFYNPHSLKTLINSKILKSRESAVYVKFHDLKDVKKILPKNAEVFTTRGIRIITPHSALISVPILGRVIVGVEKLLSRTPLGYFGGYYIVGIKKK